MNWALFRRKDGTIDLEDAYWVFVADAQSGLPCADNGATYLRDIESIEHVVSRQVAATAIATALHIARTPA